MRFVDGWMISYTGPGPFAAQMVGGLAAFVPESFATGLLAVVNTYVSQNLGAGRLKRCGQYAWAGLALAFVFCVLIAPLAFVATPIFRMLGQPADILGLEAMYFSYMIMAIFFTLTARPIEQFFYGVGMSRVVLWASIIANIVNFLLDYLLIFGRSGFVVLQRIPGLESTGGALMQFFDFDGMGLRGAAIATVVSSGAYLVFLLLIFLRRKIHVRFGTRLMRAMRLRQCLDLLKTGWPAGVQFLNDILPWSIMFSMLVGRFGEVHLAASSAAMRWMPLSFMPAVGIGVAATALVGKYIGEGKPAIARRRAHAAVLLALAYMGVCATAFLVLREPMVRLFTTVIPSGDLSPEKAAAMADQIVSLGGYVMICATVFQLFDAIGIVFVGALRGAGDTLGPMVATIVLSWSLTVGGGYLLVTYVPQWTSIGPWVAGSAYVIVMGLSMAWRFEAGGWRKINLLKRPTPAGLHLEPLPPMAAIPGEEDTIERPKTKSD